MKNKIIVTMLALFLISGCTPSSSSFGHPLSFVLEFPADIDMGELKLLEDVNCFTCGNGQKDLGKAKGRYNISLPTALWFVSLRMPKNASHLVLHLAHPSLVNLGEINLQGSDVTDADLRFLKGINLTSINLRGTEIVGEGLKYLRPNTKWTHVDLRGCRNLDLKYLAHFKGWKSTSIILTESQWGEKKSNEDKRLLEMANQVICDGQSESICGIQIR